MKKYLIDSFGFAFVVVLAFLFTCVFSFSFGPAKRRFSSRLFHSFELDSPYEATIREMGGVGPKGEVYYLPVPDGVYSVFVPEECLGKSLDIPLIPKQSVFTPNFVDNIVISEMKFRKLFSSLGEGCFGLVYFSQEQGKVSLTGTYAKAKHFDYAEDGTLTIKAEGLGQFLIKGNFKESNSYLRGDVQMFSEYSSVTDDPDLKMLEVRLLHRLRYTVKLLNILYPQKNFALSSDVLLHRPYYENVRQVELPQAEMDVWRRKAYFSYAVMDMLHLDAKTKLAFLQVYGYWFFIVVIVFIVQEPELIQRYRMIHRALKESSELMKNELKTRKSMTDEELEAIWTALDTDVKDLVATDPPIADVFMKLGPTLHLP